ncbi:hypothetical protein [Amycolatopsis keratiniphila]|nr:hypothetical protein [Amycolatopsis keratiniphila]
MVALTVNRAPDEVGPSEAKSLIETGIVLEADPPATHPGPSAKCCGK